MLRQVLQAWHAHVPRQLTKKPYSTPQLLSESLTQSAWGQVLKEGLASIAARRQTGMLRQVLQAWQIYTKRQAKKQQVDKALKHKRSHQLTAVMTAWHATAKVCTLDFL